MDSTDDAGLERDGREFLTYLGARGYSPGTICRDGRDLRRFISYCLAFDVESSATITPALLGRYRKQASVRNRLRPGKVLNVATVYNRMNTVQRFVKFLVDRNRIIVSPFDPGLMPKIPRRIPRNIPTEEDMVRLLEAPDTRGRHGLRDRAMLELMYSTGIRRGEVVGLDVYDVDLAAKTLTVRRAKGGKFRVVPMGRTACHYVARYLSEVRPKWARRRRSSALFLGEKYGDGEGRCFPTAVDHIVRVHARRALPGRRITPHMIRHAFATHMLRGGADLAMVQKLLGHSNIATTQVYTRVTPEALKEAYEKYHPYGKWNNKISRMGAR